MKYQIKVSLFVVTSVFYKWFSDVLGIASALSHCLQQRDEQERGKERPHSYPLT